MTEATAGDVTAKSIEALILSGAPYGDEARPFLTLGDIAEDVGVSVQTVRRRISDVTPHPDIESSSVGQADVYWRVDSDRHWSGRETEGERQEPLREHFEYRKNVLLSARAQWLQTKQEILTEGVEKTTAEDRHEVWRLLGAYIDAMDTLGNVSFGVAASKLSLPDEYETRLELDDYDESAAALPAGFRTENFESRLYSTPLFDSPVGSVEGLAMLLPHFVWTADELGESPPDSEIDATLPSMKDILYAGDVFDNFVSQLYAFYW